MIKKIIALGLLLSFFALVSCSPKTSQPCPHVYKQEIKQIEKSLV